MPPLPKELQRPPRCGRTLVGPYREHLRRRLAAEPGVPVTRLLAEIRELGYTGSANLLVRYLNQGRAHAERASPLILDQFLSWLMLLGRATYVLQAGRDPGGRRKTNPVAESAKDLRRWSRRPSGSGWPTGRLGW